MTRVKFHLPQVDTWAFQFSGLEKADQERVALERQIGGLPDAAMLRDAELAEGGETRTSWYTEDEPMPLYAFDQRACDRPRDAAGARGAHGGGAFVDAAERL